MNSPFKDEANTDAPSQAAGTMQPGKEHGKQPYAKRVNPNHLVIALVILLAIGNASVYPILRAAGSAFLMRNSMLATLFSMFMSVAMGMMCAEVVLHSIWTVFGNWSLGRRVALSSSTALILSASLLLPLFLIEASSSTGVLRSWDVLLTMLLCLPVISIAIQAPYWALKGGLGWRVVGPAHKDEPAKPTPLTIQHLMLATAVVAIAFTAIRLAATVQDTDVSRFTIAFTIGLGIWAGVSMAVSVPVVIAALRARQVVFWVTATVLAYAALAVTVAAIAIAATSAPIPSFAELLPIVTMFIGFFLLLTAPLLVARRMGYRLQGAETTLPATDTETEQPGDQIESPFGESPQDATLDSQIEQRPIEKPR